MYTGKFQPGLTFIAMADSSFFDDTVLNPAHLSIVLSALQTRYPVQYNRCLLVFRCASCAQRDAQLAAFKIGLQALVFR